MIHRIYSIGKENILTTNKPVKSHNNKRIPTSKEKISININQRNIQQLHSLLHFRSSLIKVKTKHTTTQSRSSFQIIIKLIQSKHPTAQLPHQQTPKYQPPIQESSTTNPRIFNHQSPLLSPAVPCYLCAPYRTKLGLSTVNTSTVTKQRGINQP